LQIKNKCENIAFLGFLSTVVLGTLFHFAFAFSGYNTLVGAFTPVNESIWEHLKLLLFPTIIISIPEYFIYGKKKNSFIISKIISLLIGLIFIVTAYYTYSGALGYESFIVDIFIFIISAAITEFATCVLTKRKIVAYNDTNTIILILILTAIIILFVYFTFDPPTIELFRDPISEDFGIHYDI
jgi:hypothetical protein